MNQEPDTGPPIRVLIVDDSAFMRTALSRMISSEPGLEIAGTARDGSDALEKIASLNPDVITLDVEMPGRDGLQILHNIMTRFPRPVIMVSAATERDADKTFRALASGAFDYVLKQLSPDSLDILHIRESLVAKIHAAAQSKSTSSEPSSGRKPPQRWHSDNHNELAGPTPAIVAIGVSTGGPKALQEILPCFPRDLPVAILVVQHMPRGYTGPFAHRLNALCSVTVREATHEEAILPGVVYIAPAGIHMKVKRSSDSPATIDLDPRPEDSLHTPSVDVLMTSVAEVFGNLALGVIMTGMGSDGAEGMKAIYRRGGFTIGQDESSCTVYGMPRACSELRILTWLAPLSQIPSLILYATKYRRRA
jgi:two-component system, chemotaxis family, protein-glutamate methylesterase/glutaminase